MRSPKVRTVQVPGRICLFGDHQDYLGLPIIACAINRFISIHAEEIADFAIKIDFIDTKEEAYFSLDNIAEYAIKGNFLAAVIKVATAYGFSPVAGYQLRISGNIPINAGLSSSSALVVAFTRFILQTFKGATPYTDALVAQIAYESEVLEQIGPGGKMDQFTIAYGGIIYLETDENAAVTRLPTNLSGLVVGESGIPKDTIGLLGDLRGNAIKSISKIAKKYPNFILEKSEIEDYQRFNHVLDDGEKAYFYAALENYRITRAAKKALMSVHLDYQNIGALMNAHHKVLRDQLNITVPLIDTMIDSALAAGAYGAKIVGSGGGGSICAICSPKTQQAVIDAIKSTGAKDAYGVEVV